MGKKSALIRTAATVILALPVLIWAEDLSFEDGRILIKTEATLKEGLASVDIRCPVQSARVYIDSVYKGLCPHKADIAPGAHYIHVQAPGHYSLHLGFVFEEKTLYTMTFTPIQIVGWLYTSLQPADASLLLDGEPIEAGFTKLPVGSYSLTARCFGYQEQTVEIQIEENRTTGVDFHLKRAAFSVSNFRAIRPRFNPANGGAAGSTTLAFTVTSYGSATIEITGPEGSVVDRIEFPSFSSWRQSKPWKGRGAKGAPLPDGVYTARLRAVPAANESILPPGPIEGGEIASDGSILLTTEISIDSSLLTNAIGSLSAMPGLSSFPAPRSQSAGTTALEFSWITPAWETAASALGLSLSLSLGGRTTLSLAGAGEFAERGSVDLAASILVTILEGTNSGAGGALFLRGSWTTAAEPSIPESRKALEFSSPWSLTFGGFTFGVSAGALLDVSSSIVDVYGLARSGLWFDGRSFRIGLSGYLPIDFGVTGSSAGPRWPAHVAAESRFMLGSSPFTFSVYTSADLEPEEPVRFSAGLGIGLLF